MRLSILQTSLHWENPKANRDMLGESLKPIAGQSDLIVLPEMFSTGFSMNADTYAEPVDGPCWDWLREQAGQLGAAITGSFMCREGEQFYNRLVFMRPNGQADYYDKRHLFTLAKEHETYTSGKKRLIVEWQGWRICPLICYDLRFPVWSRQNAETRYDLLLYVANWPARRGQHWRSLLPARAIENQTYVAGVNIVGADGNGHEYSGDSGIWDYSGQVICQLSGQAGYFTAQLSKEQQEQYRKQLAFLDDADIFQVL